MFVYARNRRTTKLYAAKLPGKLAAIVRTLGNERLERIPPDFSSSCLTEEAENLPLVLCGVSNPKTSRNCGTGRGCKEIALSNCTLVINRAGSRFHSSSLPPQIIRQRISYALRIRPFSSLDFREDVWALLHSCRNAGFRRGDYGAAVHVTLE